NYDRVPRTGRSAYRSLKLPKYVGFARVIDVLGSIQAQAVQVEFFYPVSGIGKEIFAYRPGIFPIEVDCFTPVCFVAAAEVMRGDGAEIVSRRSEVIVNHVEYYSNSESVRPIHKTP